MKSAPKPWRTCTPTRRATGTGSRADSSGSETPSCLNQPAPALALCVPNTYGFEQTLPLYTGLISPTHRHTPQNSSSASRPTDCNGGVRPPTSSGAVMQWILPCYLGPAEAGYARASVVMEIAADFLNGSANPKYQRQRQCRAHSARGRYDGAVRAPSSQFSVSHTRSTGGATALS